MTITGNEYEYETGVPGAVVTPASPGPPPRPVRRWPLFFIGMPAAVAVWSGWVGLGQMCGFGLIHPLPGLPGAAGSFQLNTAITLPVGVEAYGAYALGVWLRAGTVTAKARAFARRSAVGALALGMTGQVIYHLLAAAHATRAPWPVVTLVSCLPVIAIFMGAALTHLLHDAAAPVRAAGPVRDWAVHPAVPVPPVRGGARTAEDEAPLAGTDRAAVVEMLAAQIRDAIDGGTVWRPDYPALMDLTGRRKSWCEKVVRDARDLALADAMGGDRSDESPYGSDPGPYAGDGRTEDPVLAATP